MNSFRTEVNAHISLLKQISGSIRTKIYDLFADSKRQKRGIINGLGTIFKSITGNLDASDGEYYVKSINQLKSDQNQIENMLKNQISTTTSIINNFNSTIKQLEIDETTFNRDMNKIERSIHQLQDKLSLIEAKLKFFEICEKLMESFLFIDDNLNDILNAITFARLKIIHSSIIAPDNLISALKEISQNLVRNNLPLPVKYSSIAQFLEIIELEAFQTNTEIVFILKIPLTDPQSYTMFHLYPIPIYDNRTGIHHILSFNEKLIARDDDSLTYALIKDPSQCKQLSPRKKLCSNIYAYPIDSNAACEAQLFRNTKQLPENCQTSMIYSQGYNVQKLEDNMWLVIVAEPLHATIHCPEANTKTVIITKNAVFQLSTNCYAFVGITKVQAETRKILEVSHNPHPIIINYNCCLHVPDKINKVHLQPLNLNNLNMDDLVSSKIKLDQYSKDIDNLINKPFIEKNISWFTYFNIILIVALIFTYILYKFLPRKKTTSTNPDPEDPKLPEPLRRIRSIIPRKRPNLQPEQEEATV